MSDIFLQKYMTSGQILELGCYFHSLSRLNQRLRAYFDHGLLQRHFLPVARENGTTVYSAASGSAPCISEEVGWTLDEVRRLIRPHAAPLTLEHCLRAVDIRVAFTKAGKEAGIGIECKSELLCHHRYRFRNEGSAGWSESTFKPDGYVRLSRTGNTDMVRHCFVEADMNHVGENRIAVKLREGYQRYLDAGLFARRYGAAAFTILFVTTHDARRDRLAALAEREGAGNVRVATFTDLGRSGPLATIWRAPNAASLAALF